MDELRKLLNEKNASKEAMRNHGNQAIPNEIDEQIKYDITTRVLFKASYDADGAYAAAIRKAAEEGAQ